MAEKLTTPAYRLTEIEARRHYKDNLITTTGYLFYIKCITCPDEPQFAVPNVMEFCREWGITRAAFYRGMEQLKEKGYIQWDIKEYSRTEFKVRDRLQQELGGLIEVETPAGRIDLVTDTEIIEVKHISDWKSAMGQVLAYSGFYPKYQKRIHLFGKKGEMVSSTAVTICNELGIVVTFEEVSL